MKGKSTFSTNEAQQIKVLIRQKLISDKETQKKIRNQIRGLGFFISDFTNKKRYTLEDFEKYVTIVN